MIPVDPKLSVKEAATQNNLKSEADLIVEKVGNNEISIIGIENTEQNDFVVEIRLNAIELTSECSEEKIQILYTLFDKHRANLRKDSENNQLTIDEIISMKIKSSLHDLFAYFRSIFSLPIEVLTSDDAEKLIGKYKVDNGLPWTQNNNFLWSFQV